MNSIRGSQGKERLKTVFRLWLSRNIYRPRIGRQSDKKRLTRISLLLVLLIFSGWVYSQFFTLPFSSALQTNKLETVGLPELKPAPLQLSAIEHPEDKKDEKNQKLSVKPYSINLLDYKALRAYQLEERLNENQKKVDAIVMQMRNSREEETKPAPLPGASIEKENPLADKNISAYEAIVEYKLEVAGNIIYQKKYNREGLVGLALIEIDIDSTGKLNDAWLIESSGNSVIDQLLMESVYRASPFPSFGNMIEGDSITLQRWLTLYRK